MRGLARIELFAVAAAAAATGIAVIGCESDGAIASGDASALHVIDAGSRHDGAAPMRDDAGDDAAAPIPPKGTQLVRSPNTQIDGVTSDGYAIYTDTAAFTVNAVAITGGRPILLGPSGQLNDVFVKGNTVVFAPAAYGLGPGDLSVWTSAHPKAVQLSASAAVLDTFVAVSGDGQTIAFFDEIDADAIGDLIVVRVDGSGRQKLVSGVELSNGNCPPYVTFAGTHVVAGYCIQPPGTPVTFHASAPDAGSSHAEAADAETDDAEIASGEIADAEAYEAEAPETGSPPTPDPGGAVATVSAFAGPTWTQTTIATGVQPRFVVDANGTEVIVSSPNGLLWFPIGGALDGTTIGVAGTYGDFVNDGSAIVYTTTTNDLWRSSVAAPRPTPLSAGIAYVMATSPDENWVVGFLGLDATTYEVDLYFASATMSGPTSPLVSTVTGTTGGAYGDSFTADSSHAIFFTDIGDATATLRVASLGANPGAPVAIAPNVFAAFATTGPRIVFNDAYDSTTGTADIVSVDTTNPTATTTLVGAAGAPFYMTAAKDAVVYSWNVAGSAAGLWVMRAP